MKKLIVLGMAALLLAGCGKTVAPRHDAAYVALGDSGTSGAGIAPVIDQGCARTSKNYPHLLAARLHLVLADVSCGGAKIQNLLGFQDTSSDHKKRRPQFDALSKKTRLVTLGIGLNDDNLAYTLMFLCLPQLNQQAQCAKYLAQPVAGFAPYLDKLATDLTKAITTIQKRSPKARIVLVDYARYFPDSGSCPSLLPLPTEAADRARQVLADIHARYQAVAAQTGVLFADMYEVSKGHDVCSADPWVHGIDDSKTDGAALHPYPAYHRAVADRIAQLLGK